MGNRYKHLSAEERNELHRGLNNGLSLRAIGQTLQRPASTLSRELRRNNMTRSSYDAPTASQAACTRHRRGAIKLRSGSALQEFVFSHIGEGWSPQQIAGRMNAVENETLGTVSHETIYRAVYILPRGELRKDLISCMRQAKSLRGGRRKAKPEHGILKNTVSIYERDASVLTREFVGHWEGDFMKGKGNASAIGTIVERKSRFLIIAEMEDCSAASALEGFARELNRVPKEVRKTFTYDCGTEMAKHEELAEQASIKVYFCDPRSPWQRPSNENTNGLIRQYLPKGTDLSGYTQEDLDKVANSLNDRPRACLQFRTPREAFKAECALSQAVALDY